VPRCFPIRFDKAYGALSTALSRGVHGFAGRWLVNGSPDGILTIDLDPVQRAYVMGVPVRLRQLMVSVADSSALARALSG
jgi:hypothetical protein